MTLANGTTRQAKTARPRLMRWPWVLCGVLALLCAVAVIHNVPTRASEADRTAGNGILARAGYGGLQELAPGLDTFEGQLAAILAVQDAVISASLGDGYGIPLDREREPADLLAYGKGECSDRSRVIEKLLGLLGFKVRHVAVYSTAETGSRLVSLIVPGNSSHAVTEVRTAKGWMVVESTARWIALTEDGRVMSLEKMQSANLRAVRWNARSPDTHHQIFFNSFTYLPGLYSRHGRFFPPYTPFPDINIRDFLAGLFR